MERDYKALSTLESSHALLHLYDLPERSVTFGRLMNPSSFLRKRSDELARRPTGGGLLFHGSDFTFSLFIPTDHSDFRKETKTFYERIGKRLQELLAPFLPLTLYLGEEKEKKPSFCFAHLSSFDLTFEGKKVAGGALRRTRKGLLYQGSILLAPFKEEEIKPLITPKDFFHMQEKSFPLLGKKVSSHELMEARAFLSNSWRNYFGVSPCHCLKP